MAAYWPDTRDQALCAALLTTYPVTGPGLCYLLGALRAKGFDRETAFQIVPHIGTMADTRNPHEHMEMDV